jgi:hypothetical protein
LFYYSQGVSVLKIARVVVALLILSSSIVGLSVAKSPTHVTKISSLAFRPVENSEIVRPLEAPVSVLPPKRPKAVVILPPKPTPTPTATPRPKITGQVTGRRVILRGQATWFCLAGVSSCHKYYPDHIGKLDYYAAAGSELRHVLGPKWRNKYVYVTYNHTTVKVKLVDWCLCKGARVIDLYSDAFRKLAPLGKGVISVKISK